MCAIFLGITYVVYTKTKPTYRLYIFLGPSTNPLFFSPTGSSLSSQALGGITKSQEDYFFSLLSSSSFFSGFIFLKGVSLYPRRRVGFHDEGRRKPSITSASAGEDGSKTQIGGGKRGGCCC